MIRHPVRDAVLVLSIALISFGGSCTSDNTGGYEGGDHNTGPYGGDYGPPREGGYDHGDNSDHPHRIPRWADDVRDGTGKLKWRADLDGTYYVYDRDKDVIRYTGQIRRGSEVIIQPDDDRVYLDGRVVYQDELKRDSFHQIYFAADRQPPRHDNDDAPRDTLPDNAARLDRGTGTVTIAAVPHNGTVFIYDETSRAILYQTPIKKGNSFQVVPRDGVVNLNSQAVRKMKFAKNHTLALYFVAK